MESILKRRIVALFLGASLAAALSAPLFAAGDEKVDAEEPQTDTKTVYKVVGPDGSVTFSDSPPPGKKSEKVTIGRTNVQPITLPRDLPTRRLTPDDQQQRDRRDQGPIRFAIVSPANDATIPPGQRFIVLQVAMNPVPVDGHEFFAVVDGQRWAGTSSGTSLDISALERGTHTIQAVLLGAGGRPLAQSQAIRIHVKRPGGQVPDFPAEQAPQMPKTPQAPGVPKPPQAQPRR
ncbi:DUF4124 domain-containing protein [uncultured Microbulbifer sp.]|uniref:DUF4124 domain-containing protein n=1 Tax=uncultured Microbulbifer sp. TaxID=348147 RepID=UPI0025D23206|nr:DUF4124 domain-containing protein [uncultured Microbulbifer sp.]